MENLEIIKATLEDAEELTRLSKVTFDDDGRKHGLGDTGGPPGYDSVKAQKMWIRKALYYKFVYDTKTVGGMFIIPGNRFGRKSSPYNYYLARIFIDPGYQGLGIGSKAMIFAEDEYPQARSWSLDTPGWAIRNQHFYEKLGYKKIGEKKESENFTLIFYEKKIGELE